ncbi:MAG: hypothetical protein H7Z14_16530 [Anaerolineae bacterium]|nr:hypothetical protein [Phycisphaerae bacterium]
MNTRVISPLLSLAAILLVAGGCAGVEKRTYNVAVKNDSRVPVTVWLTKDGPLYEDKWKSPEDLAIETRRAGEMIPGVVVQPGQTVSTGKVEGKFAPHSNAILRVYVGQHNFSDLLAMSKGAPDRRDLELRQGDNEFQIVDRNGKMLVERTNLPGSTSADAPK